MLVHRQTLDADKAPLERCPIGRDKPTGMRCRAVHKMNTIEELKQYVQSMAEQAIDEFCYGHAEHDAANAELAEVLAFIDTLKPKDD